MDKLYKAMVQVDQIASSSQEADALKEQLLDIYIAYSRQLLSRSEDPVVSAESSIIEQLPSTKAVPITVDFSRKYYKEASSDLPGELIHETSRVKTV